MAKRREEKRREEKRREEKRREEKRRDHDTQPVAVVGKTALQCLQ